MTGNKSGIKPTEFKVLIAPEKIEDDLLKEHKGLKESGFIIADDEKDRLQAGITKGKIVDISPLAFRYDEDWKLLEDAQRLPGIGSRVAFARYAGAPINGADGEKYRLVNDRDIIALLD